MSAGDRTPPGFVVAVPARGSSGLPGEAAWPGLPAVRLYGGWLAGEVVRARHRSVRLLLAGHCAPGPAEAAAILAAAVDGGDLGPLESRTGACARVVVWSPREAGGRFAVSVHTDAAGQFPVYVSRRDGETLVGTHPGVLAIRHGRRPDPLTYAARIACPHVLPLWEDRSPYEGVDRVAPGTWLHLGGTPSRRAHRTPLIPAARVPRGQGAAELRSALLEAVRVRCGRGPVTADLSGGLDSTSLAFLAARDADRPVGAVTYHNPAAPAADLADAARCARLEPRLEHTTVYGDEGTLPFQGLAEPWPGGAVRWGEPAPAALAWRRSMLRLSYAASAGSRLHLTGEGADALLGAAPSYLADLARPRTAARLVRHCAAHAGLRHASSAGLAARALRTACTSPARALGVLAGTLTSAPSSPGRRPPGWPDAVAWWPVAGEAVGWLAPGARAALGEVAADPVTAGKVPGGCGPADLASLTDLRHSADTHRHLRELGAGVGVAVHAPYLDDRVVRACLRVAPAERAGPGSSKPLLAEALGGLVPRPVLERRTKGDYSAEEYRGARLACGVLRSLLTDSRLADLGVIDPVAVRVTLDRFLAGVAVPLGSLGRLVAIESWLRSPPGGVVPGTVFAGEGGSSC